MSICTITLFCFVWYGLAYTAESDLFKMASPKLPNELQVCESVCEEIDSLIETLCALDSDSDNDSDSDSKSMDNAQQLIDEHKQKISAVLAKHSPTCSPTCCTSKLLYRLLSVEPLTRVEIPLDILEMLVHSGCYDDWFGNGGHHCITAAIKSEHYAAVRWLAQKKNEDRLMIGLRGTYVNTFICYLAQFPNVPLDCLTFFYLEKI